MKKVEIDPIPNKLLHINNGYKIAAITWIIECVLENISEHTSHLNSKERQKVNKEADKMLDSLRNKREKYNGL